MNGFLQSLIRHRRLLLGVEFAIVFLVVPGSLFYFRRTFGSIIIPSLVGLSIICLTALLTDSSFERPRLWDIRAFWPRLGRTLLVFLPLAVAVGLLTAWYAPELLFRLPRERPILWIAILVLYPILSVYPQEVIFRTFLFHRYRRLFRSTLVAVLASGITFGVAHLFFNNWIAPAMSTIGGILFAHTYARTGSTLQAGLEHALWGNFIFTIGLGFYFYGGAIQ